MGGFGYGSSDPLEPLAITCHINTVNSSNPDGPTLARTFHGGITRWDGPVIEGKQLNLVHVITSVGPDPVSITTGSVAKTIAGARQ